MKKKNKKVYKAILHVFSVVALAFLGFGVIALVWQFVYGNPLKIVIFSGGFLLILLTLGIVKWKQIKRKVVDIFT